jgi:hypothetical protein
LPRRAPIRAGDSPQLSALVRKPTCLHPLVGYRSHSRSLFDDCLVGAHGFVRGGRRVSCGWEGERSMQQGVRPWRPSRVVGEDVGPQLRSWSRTPARIPEELRNGCAVAHPRRGTGTHSDWRTGPYMSVRWCLCAQAVSDWRVPPGSAKACGIPMGRGGPTCAIGVGLARGSWPTRGISLFFSFLLLLFEFSLFI